jgi:hypothetical protein
MSGIGTISEARIDEGREPEIQPQRLNEEHPSGMVVQSDLHGNVQRLAETTNPGVETHRVTYMILCYNFLSSQRLIIRGRTAA